MQSKKINSRKKGSRGELEWSKFCQTYGFSCRRTAQYCGNTGDASDVVGLPLVHQEVKRVERLNVENAMQQAVRDASAGNPQSIPIVAHRKNHREWLVTMRAQDWFSMYAAFLGQNGGDSD